MTGDLVQMNGTLENVNVQRNPIDRHPWAKLRLTSQSVQCDDDVMLWKLSELVEQWMSLVSSFPTLVLSPNHHQRAPMSHS